jgi:hypothetical protein
MFGAVTFGGALIGGCVSPLAAQETVSAERARSINILSGCDSTASPMKCWEDGVYALDSAADEKGKAAVYLRIRNTPELRSAFASCAPEEQGADEQLLCVRAVLAKGVKARLVARGGLAVSDSVAFAMADSKLEALSDEAYGEHLRDTRDEKIEVFLILTFSGCDYTRECGNWRPYSSASGVQSVALSTFNARLMVQALIEEGKRLHGWRYNERTVHRRKFEERYRD